MRLQLTPFHQMLKQDVVNGIWFSFKLSHNDSSIANPLQVITDDSNIIAELKQAIHAEAIQEQYYTYNCLKVVETDGGQRLLGMYKLRVTTFATVHLMKSGRKLVQRPIEFAHLLGKW